jgi:hypothetical protein
MASADTPMAAAISLLEKPSRARAIKLQNAVIKYQANIEMTISQGDFVLPADKSKTFSKLKEKVFQVVN